MVHTYRSGYDEGALDPAVADWISFNYDWSFRLDAAAGLLNLSRSRKSLTFVSRSWWWNIKHREFAKLLDFLCYRGIEIFHHVGPFTVPHTAYFSGPGGRLEKLYDDQTLDEWAKV